jgi:hypothetical protein
MMKEKTEQLVPRMRTKEVVVQELGDEVLVYDRLCHRAYCLNRTAATIWKLCDGKTTLAKMAELMTKKFDTPVADDVIWFGLGQLQKARLVDEQSVAPSSSPFAAMSRREAMRRVGLAAAVLLPVVTSIIAPKAAQAASCTPNGEACHGNGNCCSHNCVGDICV